MDTLEYLHARRRGDRRGAVLLPDQLHLHPGRARLRLGYRAGAVSGGLRPLDGAAAGRPPAALSLRPQPRRDQLGAVGAALRGARRPDPGRGLGRPALSEPRLALDHRRAAARLARLAAALRRRVVRPLHQPGERPRHSRRDMGADADRLPAICERPDRLLRAGRVLPHAGMDGGAARARRVAGPALVSRS